MGEKISKVGEAGDRVEIGQDLARIDQACVMGARTLDGAGWVRTLATRRVVINMHRRATMRVRIAGAAWNPGRPARQSATAHYRELAVTRTVSRAARLLAALAAAALTGGVLAGCSAHPGQAYVGTYTGSDGKSHSVSVSEKDVQTASAELSDLPGMDVSTVQENLLSLQLFEGTAKKYGVVVSDDDARAALADSSGSGDYSRASIDVARSVLISRALNSLDDDRRAAFASEVGAIQASLVGEASPRYTFTQKGWRVPSSDELAPGGSRQS